MDIVETNLKGCFILKPKILEDERGYFVESFNQRLFCEAIQNEIHFVQDNQSFSTKGVVRGLHYQVGNHAQSKLVRVLTGSVLDVAVDIRTDSKTYGQHIAEILSAENQRQIFIPAGFAHGFAVLSDSATLFYKCDNFYNKEAEAGIFYNDPELNIQWGEDESNWILSERDMNLPNFQNARKIW